MLDGHQQFAHSRSAAYRLCRFDRTGAQQRVIAIEPALRVLALEDAAGELQQVSSDLLMRGLVLICGHTAHSAQKGQRRPSPRVLPGVRAGAHATAPRRSWRTPTACGKGDLSHRWIRSPSNAALQSLTLLHRQPPGSLSGGSSARATNLFSHAGSCFTAAGCSAEYARAASRCSCVKKGQECCSKDRESPAATQERTVLIGNREPLKHGTPPITSGSTLINGSIESLLIAFAHIRRPQSLERNTRRGTVIVADARSSLRAHLDEPRSLSSSTPAHRDLDKPCHTATAHRLR
jgi:hypothetical protein